MPRKSSIKRVLIIGSGPIVIGQACEFDYSGTQACKALMKEGLEVILVNSNPATIMTDPEIATRVYVEPLKVDYLEKIIAKEMPDAVIPTLGGQTALNLALDLHAKGILQKYKVQLLGATPQVIKAGEDREIFRGLLDKIGAKYPKSHLIRTYEHGLQIADELGYPMILRPNYTLGGGGGGIAYSPEEYKKMLVTALHESPTSEVLVEESILGWKEYELEVMRDHKGTFVVVCSIENLDPCGVHTGDSITVAPQQTLSDREYQSMRDEACKIINEVGIETGGANIQFAVHPTTKERVVIEMNPRVSRSSALASKATGFPIAKIAALLAIGYSLDELQNDITKVTPSCYEPALDYIVTKIPRFAFEKFAGSKDSLTTQMKSVGEVMGIGRTLQESLMKALASLEKDPQAIPEVELETGKISYPNSRRIYHLFQAFRDGKTVAEIEELTRINPYFLEHIEALIKFERMFKADFTENNVDLLLKAKRKGFTDARLAALIGKKEADIRALREKHQMFPRYQQVDTCAGEFESSTPYFYSSYWPMASAKVDAPDAVVVIGSGPNRIGQGIEFDYSCVRGVKGFQKNGRKVIMVNSNPETVSTDYDTSDVLFFEPLTVESLSEIMRFMKPYGFVAQLGGQTPIGVAPDLVKAGYRLLGSSLETIDLAEDRGLFSKICRELNFEIPNSGMAGSLEEALRIKKNVGYPMICRPSYVLGGRRMEVIENTEELLSYFQRHKDYISPEKPCLMDQFLAGALEVDVDLVRGEDWVVVGGIVEHIEAAGVHSGDSMGVLPPHRLKPETCERIEDLSKQLANRIGVIGHLNLQLAVKNDVVYMLEANPRSSRSVPFVAKATGIPLIDLGVAAMLGKKKKDLKLENLNWRKTESVSVKGVVFPFKKFPESDSILGPEMKSTGESMGRGKSYSEALAKAFLSSNIRLPKIGQVFFSLRDKDKEVMLPLARELQRMGYGVSATTGTANFFNEKGVNCLSLRKVDEGRPHCVDKIRSGDVAFVINTTSGRRAIEASFDIRRACTDYNIPCLTESDAAEAFILALKNERNESSSVEALGAMEEF
ncbi:Carbamoyl-phosphate synthase large chain [Bdellovibrio bacteriovorus]|uniref:carbamoyl-phosphate synthase large subunit n=1 Tax=Bdellovibrio bacteriovorus TaxID=959 RepID=UPI00045BF297|nr:carbamoyl-phosphate synthase large subunit [Bdellovibrio bacteriovorus]AHZ86912.1 carbamoyl phosphate synthase large subunit [Bdellovibrio bacteriovorus]BEV67353.1 Carbamoyl-phosphate synthase large chain [Bdellovibrio bacteriovorus]